MAVDRKEVDLVKERARGRRYYWKNIDKIRARYALNKEKVVARNRKWRAANSERSRAYQRAYYKANKEKHNAQSTAWRQAHKNDPQYKERLHQAYKRRREELNARGRKQWAAVRYRVLTIYGLCCACCGEHRLPFLAIDHINGGGNRDLKNSGNSRSMWKRMIVEKDPAKYQTLCWNCNAGKVNNFEYPGICPHEVERRTMELDKAA